MSFQPRGDSGTAVWSPLNNRGGGVGPQAPAAAPLARCMTQQPPGALLYTASLRENIPSHLDDGPVAASSCSFLLSNTISSSHSNSDRSDIRPMPSLQRRLSELSHIHIRRCRRYAECR